MNPEQFFKTMYFDIWQSHDINKIDQYYAKDFEEIIDVSNLVQEPIELKLDYAGIVKQAKWQQDHYRNTTLNIKKIVTGQDNCISVHFYSTSIDKKTGELKHRCVCGIWQLNDENQINRVWAVVTPYYPEL